MQDKAIDGLDGSFKSTGALETLAAHFPDAPATRPIRILLNDQESAAAWGISTKTFHQLRKQPWMPKPIMLGPRLLRWSAQELEQAIAMMPRQAEVGPKPAQLVRRGSIANGAAQ